MVISIDNSRRKELGISTEAYTLLMCMWLMRSQERDAIEVELDWTRSKIGQVMKEVEAAGLFTEFTGEFSDEWMSMFNPMENVDLSGLHAVTEAIIEYINLTTGRAFRNSRGFQKNISRLVKAVPKDKGTSDHFKVIIAWAWSEWGEEYKKYVGPNLFDCTPEKYMERLEKAIEWYERKTKA